MTLRFRYDPDADVAYVRFSGDEIVQSEEISPGVIFDYDSADRTVGVEFLRASKRLPEDALR